MSFPWEGPTEANKDSIVHACVEELDRICRTSANINKSIKPFIEGDTEKGYYPTAFVRRWETEPYQMGAARLYDQREWADTQAPMVYNQEYSDKSRLYLAGESYHVDAGWTEPALRMAIDSVIHICEHERAEIKVPNFSFATDYPKYSTTFQPREPMTYTNGLIN